MVFDELDPLFRLVLAALVLAIALPLVWVAMFMIAGLDLRPANLALWVLISSFCSGGAWLYAYCQANVLTAAPSDIDQLTHGQEDDRTGLPETAGDC